MSPRLPSSPSGGDASQDTPQGDPWHAFGYLVSGVLMYGVLGWLADRWLGTSFVVVVGILFGAGLGIYMTFARFNRPWALADQARPGRGSSGRQERHQHQAGQHQQDPHVNEHHEI
ncbi:AtpZ/AtpI family protein [Nocardioides mesophilus]|uniref:AtpZ/AtpI family protein n=1 Tax=Nocardioides mesophilus TaxID=433659 RepID=A0A7G9R8N6_9ACTN|nr:AtpZ/AtpI family protein [Nocardioides mesophilus]QNN51961.1 AtpZ/AtpI family protein [Nocardioides mesophilus]